MHACAFPRCIVAQIPPPRVEAVRGLCALSCNEAYPDTSCPKKSTRSAPQRRSLLVQGLGLANIPTPRLGEPVLARQARAPDPVLAVAEAGALLAAVAVATVPRGTTLEHLRADNSDRQQDEPAHQQHHQASGTLGFYWACRGSGRVLVRHGGMLPRRALDAYPVFPPHAHQQRNGIMRMVRLVDCPHDSEVLNPARRIEGSESASIPPIATVRERRRLDDTARASCTQHRIGIFLVGVGKTGPTPT